MNIFEYYLFFKSNEIMRFLIILLCLTSVNALGQTLKKKKNTGTFFEEIYTIDKSTKEKQGYYLKTGKSTQDTLAFGSYEQGKKSGIWSFRGRNNSLFMNYDYDQKKLVAYHGTTYEQDSIQVKIDGAYKVSKVDHPPRYIGFKNEISRVLKYTIRPPASVFEEGKAGMVLASFEVSEFGEATNLLIESSYNLKLIEPIKKSIAAFKNDWIPAAINGTPITAKMYLIFNFDFVAGYEVENKSKFDERADLIVVDMIYMGMARGQK